MRRWIICCALSTLAASPAVAEIFYVGDGPGCDATSIGGVLLQPALTPGADEIRVARNRPHESQYVHLTDWDPATVGALTIRGGYSSCTDATGSGRTVVSGRANAPVFEIDTSSASSRVTLERLEISGSGEHGVLVEGDSTVDIIDCAITFNGWSGLGVFDGPDVTVDTGSTISYNSGVPTFGGTIGGGIYCETATVTFAGEAHSNTAYFGGGVGSVDCTFTIASGGWIRANHALSRGGGLIVGGGQMLVDGSQPTQYATRIANNTCDGDGGGVFADSGTVTIHNASVEGNQATLFGAGLFAWFNGVIVMEGVQGVCNDPVRCSRLAGNTLGAAGNGIAASAEQGGEIRISRTFVEANSRVDDDGPLFYATGLNTRLEVEGSQLWGNTAETLFEGHNNASLIVAYVSAAQNRDNAVEDASIMNLSTDATGAIFSSVLWPADGAITASGGTITEADCLIVSTTLGLPPSAQFVTVVDPMFADAAGGDLRITPGSPAIDYCDDRAFPAPGPDIDLEARGFDIVSDANGSPGVDGGTFDLGFDEFGADGSLFADGFETGNSAAWSATVP